MAFDAPDYLAALERFVHDYRGSRERAVHLAPAVFGFYARLFGEQQLLRHQHALVNAVLAYFVVPDDVLPESELGPVGLMDDLFVAAHVYRLLRREAALDVLRAAWLGDTEMDEAMDEVYAAARTVLGKRMREVLRMAGLS